jgi:hypothetical protein
MQASASTAGNQGISSRAMPCQGFFLSSLIGLSSIHWNDSASLQGCVRVVDGFTAAKAIQERVAAGEVVDREVLRGLALAVLAGSKAGRLALAVLRAVSDKECLSWALELSDAVLAGATEAGDTGSRRGL